MADMISAREVAYLIPLHVLHGALGVESRARRSAVRIHLLNKVAGETLDAGVSQPQYHAGWLLMVVEGKARFRRTRALVCGTSRRMHQALT